MTTTADQLVEEFSGLDAATPNPERMINLNYTLRLVLSHIVKHYEEDPDVAYASDVLARVIHDIELEF